MIEKLKPCPNPLCRSTDVRQGKDCLDSVYVTCEDCGMMAYLSAWNAMQARALPADVRAELIALEVFAHDDDGECPAVNRVTMDECPGAVIGEQTDETWVCDLCGAKVPRPRTGEEKLRDGIRQLLAKHPEGE